MTILRYVVWETLPLTAPGLLKTELMALIVASGRPTNHDRTREAIVELQDQGALQDDGKMPARYWRGPIPPLPSAKEPDYAWPEASIQILRTGWALGKTAAEIGREIGCKKNAILGKARRLKLPARLSPIVNSGERSRYPTKSKPRLATLPPLQTERMRIVPDAVLAAMARERQARAVSTEPPMLMLAPPPMLIAEPPKPPRSLVPLPPSMPKPRVKPEADELYTWDRRGSKCQWVTVEKPRVRMCSADTPFGHAWCPQHRMICFNRSHAARSEAE
jgi:GcrA cell cycle regulator